MATRNKFTNTIGHLGLWQIVLYSGIREAFVANPSLVNSVWQQNNSQGRFLAVTSIQVPPHPSLTLCRRYERPALRVQERHGNVAGPAGGGEALVVVGQAAWVHERPAFPGGPDGAVVAYEPAAAALQGKGKQ